MKRRQIFDAHHHLWDLGHCHYPWLMAKGVKRFFGNPAPIQKNYLIEDFLGDAERYDLVGSTHIQVGVAEENAVKETEWLQSVADQSNLPSAIVAFADLASDNAEETIDQHAAYANFRGVRQIIGRHPIEDGKTGTGALLDDPNFLRGLKILEDRNYSFDLQLTAAHYDGTVQLFQRLPDLKVAICHFASPWDLTPDGFANWRRAMKLFSELPQCFVKFSGFGMFKPDWGAEDIKPYVGAALEFFGPDRCMAGSNFPVDKLYGGYDRIWRALEALIRDETTLHKVTVSNGAKFYCVQLTT